MGGELGEPLEGIGVLGGEGEGVAVEDVAAEGTGGVGSEEAESAWEVRDEVEVGTALGGLGVAQFGDIGSIVPDEVRGDLVRGREAEELRVALEHGHGFRGEGDPLFWVVDGALRAGAAREEGGGGGGPGAEGAAAGEAMGAVRNWGHGVGCGLVRWAGGSAVDRMAARVEGFADGFTDEGDEEEDADEGPEGRGDDPP